MKNFDPYSPREQIILLLLVALRELRKPKTKFEVIQYIESKKWFNLRSEDLIPYKSTQGTEERWKTLIAWARKDCVDANLMEYDSQNCWEASKNGLNIVVGLKQLCQAAEFSVGHCYLWSLSLKSSIHPEFMESANDPKRPMSFYRDSYAIMLKTPSGKELLNRLVSHGSAQHPTPNPEQL